MDKSPTILNNKNILKIICPTDHTLHKTFSHYKTCSIKKPPLPLPCSL